jgi:hypothetical protein
VLIPPSAVVAHDPHGAGEYKISATDAQRMLERARDSASGEKGIKRDMKVEPEPGSDEDMDRHILWSKTVLVVA